MAKKMSENFSKQLTTFGKKTIRYYYEHGNRKLKPYYEKIDNQTNSPVNL